MLRIALKGIVARWRRLLLTSLVIVIGVAFISGTAVLSDLLSRSVNELVDAAYRNVDVVVRSRDAQENPFSTDPIRRPVAAAVVDLVADAPGVEVAAGELRVQPQLLDPEGEPVSAFGPPVLAQNWIPDDRLRPSVLVDGHAPEGPDEIVMDVTTAEDLGFALGDPVTVQFASGGATFTLVGVGGLGEDGRTTTGAKVLQLQTERLQELNGTPGEFGYVAAVSARGVSQEELAATIAPTLPDDLEVRTGEEFIAENQESIGQIVDIITQLVAAFGYLAAFVAVFVIYNVFSILIAQRTRELALLRAVGAGRLQILGSVMLEALVLGLVAAVIGLFVGYGLATVARAGLGNLLTLSEGAARLTTTAVTQALVVGVVATLFSAIIPAVRATRVPPVAAMSVVGFEGTRLSWSRRIVGTLCAVGGLAAVIGAVRQTLDPVLTWVGLGSGLLFVALVMVGPVVAGPLSRLIGSPLPRLRGTPGRLARDNAARNPKRTTATGVALTIGVAVVVVIAVIASSFKYSLANAFETQIRGDLIVSSGFGPGGFDTGAVDVVRGVDGVANATSFRFGAGCSLDSKKAAEIASAPAEVSDTDPSTCRTGESETPPGENVILIGIEPDSFFDLIDVGTVDPSTTAIVDDTITVQDTVLEENGWEIGQKVRMWFSEVGEQIFTVAATYDKPFGGGGGDQYVVTASTYDRVSNPVFRLTNSIYVDVADDASVDGTRAAIAAAVAPIAPAAQVQDIGTFVREQTDALEGFLNIIYVLLALAIVVAVAGISITMSLSVFERTRELGLLRAVGMERRQMRTTVRWEAAVIGLFGTGLGLGMGMALAAAFVRGFADQGIVLDLPWTTLAIIAVGGAAAGMLAATRPARRAARLDILAAIATE